MRSNDQAQRLSQAEIAVLLGLDVPAEIGERAGPGNEREELFWVQLRVHRSAAVVGAVEALLEDWKARGQILVWDNAAESPYFPW